MARKTNMVPNSAADFDSDKQLIRRDVKILRVLVVLIKWSKTNQFGSRLLKVPLLAIPDFVLCTVLANENMMRATPASPDDPVFSMRTNKGKVKPLIYRH